jgi:hypothetical protein
MHFTVYRSKQAKQAIEGINKYLQDEIIPGFIESMSGFEFGPTDGISLTAAMHQAGINIRYLGKIHDLSKNAHLPHIAKIAETEMIARAVKHIIARTLRQSLHYKSIPNKADMLPANAIATILNHIMNNNTGKMTEEEAKSLREKRK